MKTIFFMILTILIFICSTDIVKTQNHDVKKNTGISEKRIVPEEGYKWPQIKRKYWPTLGWKKAPMEKHGIDPKKMLLAEKTARNDTFFRCILVVKNGFIVFEKYFHGGGQEQSTEVWSVTKSFTSALIGIAIDKGYIDSIDKLMTDYLPDYPEFRNITIKHVLTQTTGLNWNERSLQTWIQSNDWIAEAVRRGFFTQPGKTLLYSSGNSHFLSGLIKKTTGKTPGEFAKRYLFNPIGIKYKSLKKSKKYTNWNELHIPVPGTWRQGNQGLEIGAFGLHINAREMAKFGFLYLNKGKWEGKTVISEKWVEESTRDYVLRTDTFGFGYHWVVAKRAGQISFDADGWGGQHISVIPALDMIIVIKCDAVNPQGKSSYRVLKQTIEAVLTK